MKRAVQVEQQEELFKTYRTRFAERWTPTIADAGTVDGGDAEEEEEEEEEDGADENDEDEDEDEDDDDFDVEEDDDEADEDDLEASETSEPDGQFPTAQDTPLDTERPGGKQNRHGDRGGVS